MKLYIPNLHYFLAPLKNGLNNFWIASNLVLRAFFTFLIIWTARERSLLPGYLSRAIKTSNKNMTAKSVAIELKIPP